MHSLFFPRPRPARRFKVLSALIVGLGLCCAVPAMAAEPTLAEIQSLIKQRQLPQALEKADAYTLSHPRDAQGRFFKGVALTEMNRTNEAIAVFIKLTEDFPELPEPYNNLAVLYAQQKQYDKARAALEMAIRTHPSYAIAHENLGDVYAKLASQAYDKALQLDSSNAGAQTKLSLIKEIITVPPRGGARNAAPVRAPAPVAVAPRPAPAPAPQPAPVPAKVTVEKSRPTPPPVAPQPAPAKVTVAAKTPEKEKPQETAKAAAKSDADESALTKQVQSWAGAWSRKDVKGYLNHYAGNFQVPGGGSRQSWEKERSARIDKPGKIQVQVEDIKVSMNGDKATVRFKQHYKSATLSSSASKTLVFTKSGGKWLILQEKVGG